MSIFEVEKALDFLKNILLEIPPFVIIIIIAIFGLYIFWKGCIEKKKNISSIFDIFILSTLFGFVTSRISYIIINIYEFNKLIWYWIPYEKYGEDIYLFRLLPWKYLSIWDGGLDIFSLILGFMIMATLLSIFMKRWRWKDMFLQIYFSGITVFCLLYAYVGITSENYDFLTVSAIIFLIEILVYAISRILLGSNIKARLKNRVNETFSIISIIGTAIYLTLYLLSLDSHFWQELTVYIFILWLAISVIYFLTDLRKANVSIEKISTVRNMGSVDVNHPIKIKE